MAQFSRRVRIAGLTKNFANRKEMDKAKALLKSGPYAGQYAGGIVTLAKPTVTMVELRDAIVKIANGEPHELGIEIPKTEKEQNSQMSSLATGLRTDVQATRADSEFLQVGDSETGISGTEWFLTLPENVQKKGIVQYGKLIAKAVKDGSVKILKPGIEIELPKCTAKTGKQGRSASKLSDYVADL